MSDDVTLMLQAVSRGEKQASEALLPLVYAELRQLAAARMAREMSGHTLQPTALVHEAWLRLTVGGSQTWENRAHFFGAASEAMRRILIENARRKAAVKYGGELERIELSDLEISSCLPDEKILLLDDALEHLKTQDPDTARVVTLKFYGGLNHEEIVQVMGTSDRTVRRQWNYAKVWLFDWIRKQHESHGENSK